MTIDAELAAAAADAVREGRAESVSAWVNEALKERADKESKLAALRAAIADYEAEYGAFTDEELAAQERADREAAARVREEARRRRAAT